MQIWFSLKMFLRILLPLQRRWFFRKFKLTIWLALFLKYFVSIHKFYNIYTYSNVECVWFHLTIKNWGNLLVSSKLVSWPPLSPFLFADAIPNLWNKIIEYFIIVATLRWFYEQDIIEEYKIINSTNNCYCCLRTEHFD